MKALFFPFLAAAALVCGQAPAPPEYKGIPARATPADYMFQAKAGTVTIAAEFTGHSIPTADGPLTTEDFIAVEVALYGPAGEKLKITSSDFSLRLAPKKGPLSSQPFGAVFSSLKDPEYLPPDPPQQKSKGGINTGGGGGGGESSGPPPPVKIPVPVMRAMAQRVQKAALPEGDRALPVAGMIFFSYRGKTNNLQVIELIYEGPAGKAVVKLQK